MRRAALLVVVSACGHAVNASQIAPRTVAIQCPSGPRGCHQRAVAACRGGYDIVDTDGRDATPYVGEMFVRCRGSVDPDALGYRDCMGPASCEAGDRCVFTSDAFGKVGRCVAR